MGSKKELADVIRKYAVEHVSMEAVMKPIIAYIESYKMV